MAGFRHRAPALVDIAMVAHPSVTLLFDLSEGEGLVCDTHGRHERGSVVVGLLPGDLRAAGRRGDCLQIRLQPVAAAAVLGASAELSGTMAALKDVWGRDAGRVEDRLRAAASWDELTPTAVAEAPWLAIDDVAWPASSPTRSPALGGDRLPG
ncbi:hypothetical protein [Plantactinospora sp. KLBMP9567]|uniref:hypothetical protein n=1 Tax=Plantactinospora sp. KLBMP9567 TaxID=3085900 RepID=UPI002981D11D|nr:hypothetical protein [Plantactinospora sp. KLBMP9567]MDW5324360.1 hypothetical protein [Plantactinospora sp. KLBMP9567]